MSFQAMTWAVEQELPAMQKIVLLMLANRTNHDTGLCFPSHDTLAKECGMSKSSVIRQIEALENGEFLKVVRTKKADGSNNPNHYRLKLNAVGSVTVKPPLVSERDHPSVTVTPEPEIKPITITTIENENFLTFDGLPPEQIECYAWAKNHDYWNFATVSIHKFLTIYTKPKRDGLKAQFDEHKKALQDGRGQTGRVQSQSMKKNTEANYATHSTNHKKLTAAQRAKQLGERANAFNNGNVIDSTASVV
jgi:hypothetical protein